MSFLLRKVKPVMKRYIVTGAPGAGKTAVIQQLEIDGFAVVEEAATDVIALWQAKGIAEPWTHPEFIDAIVGLQQSRERQSAFATHPIQFHDRSVVCTAALADYLKVPRPKTSWRNCGGSGPNRCFRPLSCSSRIWGSSRLQMREESHTKKRCALNRSMSAHIDPWV